MQITKTIFTVHKLNVSQRNEPRWCYRSSEYDAARQFQFLFYYQSWWTIQDEATIFLIIQHKIDGFLPMMTWCRPFSFTIVNHMVQKIDIC